MTDTVLIVDDDPFISRAFERSLCDEEFETLTAESAVEALRILQKREIAVVISDQQMPEMSGSELMVIIRERYPDTVRILLSGHATLELAIEAINRAEVHRFLLKPCRLAELADTIRRAVACRAALKEIRAKLEAIDAEPRLIDALERHPREAHALCPPEGRAGLAPVEGLTAGCEE